MGAAQERLGQWLLRFGSPLAGLRRWPVIGTWVGWAAGKLVPRNSLTWVQVQTGGAQGLWLHLNPRTGGTYFEGDGEPEVQRVLQQQLKPGMVFYDVGANIGLFSLMAARLVGERGGVVAFEADPEIAARLREHVARNEFARVRAEEKAVWCKAGPLYFARTDPEASPDRGLGHVVGEKGADTVEVEGVTLDQFAFEGREPAPDFIKCDVEGAEVEVFRGGQRLLREKRPGIICEMHSAENLRVLSEMFASFGYTCTDCGSNHVLALRQ